MIRKLLTFLLTAFILQCLHGCAAQPTLIGTWNCTEEATQLGLGVSEPATLKTHVTFVFEDDGTGSWITAPEGYPETALEFTYNTDGDTLTLAINGLSSEIFTYTLTDTTLKLDSPRAVMELTRQ